MKWADHADDGRSLQDDQCAAAAQAARHAREALAGSVYFRGRADCLHFVQRGDVLVVLGAVPSYFLKQVLQEVLKGVRGIRRVDNQVDVVSCEGLSGVRRIDA